jgi:hypothetical protein
MLKLNAIPRLLPALTLASAIAFAQGAEIAPSDKIQIAKNTENYLKYLKEARTEQIKQRLGIPEGKAAAIAAKWATLEAPIRRRQLDAKETKRQMQYILQLATSEKEKSSRIKPFYEQYMELRKELSMHRQRLYHELPAMGETPTQQAQMLFLMEELNRRERDALKGRMSKKSQTEGQKSQ